MKNTVRALLVLLAFCGLLTGQVPKGSLVPMFNPNGVWESISGTKYNLRLSGDDLLVKLEGKQDTYVQYEMKLKHLKAEDTAGDPNRYEGTGFFVAKLKSGKECRFETKWEIAMIGEKAIVGNAPRYLEPDPETCKPKETIKDRIDLKKT
jgi:hypothetical protein